MDEDAILWSGSANSYVNLSPFPETHTRAYAISGDHQVGLINGISNGEWYQHAAMWSGTAASFVNLNPTGSTSSAALAVLGDRQVGGQWTRGRESGSHAGIWQGTADSFFDLHDLLPANFRDTEAHGIGSDGTYIYVAGSGVEKTGPGPNDFRYLALLWKGELNPPPPAPEPGTLVALSFGCLFAVGRCRRSRRLK
jgi:hypothetical protein